MVKVQAAWVLLLAAAVIFFCAVATCFPWLSISAHCTVTGLAVLALLATATRTLAVALVDDTAGVLKATPH